MPLSWNEIKSRALAFSKDWKDAGNEDSEAKPFLIDFLNIFGISQKRVATFELRVKKLNESDGYIDLLWKGTLLVEMKSRGKDLDKAYQQAKDYCHGLQEHELPKLIMVCDFERFQVYDDEGNTYKFTLPELLQHVHVFGIIANYQKRTYKEQDPVNIQAAELMGKLHDKLKEIGYTGHNLELYLVRLLFCLFADDTSIFEKGIFHDYISLKTKEDGSDLAAHIGQLFQVLNTPENSRLKNLDEDLMAFPYVNGKLFEETLPFAHFDSSMRKALLDCCRLDWGKISPAIFGSLFQSVMDEKARRNLGAHYTSEKNIMKVIKPLFLDELWDEFNDNKNDKRKLQKLHEKISKLKFLDPACGCGNFLIIAYRELRLLELEIVKILLKGQQVTSINDYFLVDVDQFYGIEYEEFPSQIAQVAMWLMDHQMNEAASGQFGEYYKRIPLKKSATIVCGNALRLDWQSLLKSYPWEKEEPRYNYIFGNPPFIGAKWQSQEQRKDIEALSHEIKNYGLLDYVCGWFIMASNYCDKHDNTEISFVSTNSISQGEQVYPLWNYLLGKGIKINFAYKTFTWKNEAKGNAAVHVIIIGFSKFNRDLKQIFETQNNQTIATKVNSLNPYLFEGKSVLIPNRSNPICKVPEMLTGNKPIDGGNYIFTESEMIDFVNSEPNAKKYFRIFLGAEEFINGKKRFILVLKDANPSELNNVPKIKERIEQVRSFRLKSSSKPTQKLALTPTLFHTENIPSKAYLVIPQVSSVRRKYIPIGYLQPEIICSDKLRILRNATLFHFGVLTSEMHMIWMKTITGRLKSDYQYSVLNVYNNFPWPESPTEKQKDAVEKAAQAVLDARAQFPDSSLADLYDPNTMPPVLVKAHQALDKAVDLCYRPQPFPNEAKRIEFLFELYDKYTAGLFVKEKKTIKKRVV